MNEFRRLVCESPAPHVARTVLNRPETRNAQNSRLASHATACQGGVA